MNADGSGLRKVMTPQAGGAPIWSPDGTRIAFTGGGLGGFSNVYIVDSDGANLVQITNAAAWEGVSDWSPDGTSLLVNRGFPSEHTAIWTYPVNGSDPKQLTFNTHTAQDLGGVWSPDGKQIAFWSDRDGDFEIFVMDNVGSNVRQLTYNHEWDGTPAWSPDGSQIAFVKAIENPGDFQIHVMNEDGSGIRRITDDGGHSPDW
jgi:TolB protein